MSSKERHQAVTDLEGSTTLLQMKDPHPRSQSTNCLHTSVIILALLVGSASLTIAGMLFMEVRELKTSMANLNVQILELNDQFKSNQDDLGVDGEMQAFYQYDDSDFEVSSGDEIDGIQDDTEEDSEDGAGRHRRARKTRNGREKKKSEGDKKECKLLTNKDGKITFKKKLQETCKNALDSYIEGVVDKRIEEQSSLGAIHLAGNVNMGSSEQQTMRRLHSNASDYVDLPEQHGKMYYQGFMPNNETLAFWKQANWTLSNSKTNATYKFDESAGTIEVQKSGLYFLYAQVHYRTTMDTLSFHIKTDTFDRRTKQTTSSSLFMCKATGATSSESDETQLPRTLGPQYPIAKAKGCWTGGIVYLKKRQKVYIWNRYIYPIYVSQPATFWGMFRLS